MEPATAIAITQAAIALTSELVSVWGDINGDKQMVVNVINATADADMKLAYQSEDDDEDQHGKFVKSPPRNSLAPGQNCLVSSSKSNWSATGNTNGLVYGVTRGGVTRYLTIAWCVPYLGAPYYHVGWSETWDKNAMRSKLLTGLASRKITDSNLYNIYGMQRSQQSFGGLGDLYATSTFGFAPLRVFVHPGA
jgi:hypothetical protein